jgi:hypothetical protein
MAKWAFGTTAWTPTATADNSTLANSTYMALIGGSGSQRIEVIEIFIAGVGTASNPTYLMLCRDSTIATTPTALSAPAYCGPMDPATAALSAPPVGMTAAGTGPKRSIATTDARLNLGLNAFGGIVRWIAAPREEWIIYGNTAQLGESSLSAYTGGTPGAIDSHIVFEPL